MRDRTKKQGLADRGEPDLKESVAAAEDQPVAVTPAFEVEAVVGRGLLKAGDVDRVEAHRPLPSVFFSQATRMLTN